MKRMGQIVLVGALSVMLLGCSGPGTSASTTEASPSESAPTAAEGEAVVESSEAPVVASAEGSPEEVLAYIEQDFEATAQGLLDEQTALFAQTGDTYEGYAGNVQAVQGWYDLAVSETEALGARTLENARQYYRSVVATIDHGDEDALDAALDDFYDLIYDDAFDSYYDAIYDDAFGEMYDYYYDGSIDGGYDTMPYDEWYDSKSDAYDAWYDSKSDVYDGWYDAKSDVYDEWFDVNSGFYNNEFDINEVLRLDE